MVIVNNKFSFAADVSIRCVCYEPIFKGKMTGKIIYNLFERMRIYTKFDTIIQQPPEDQIY